MRARCVIVFLSLSLIASAHAVVNGGGTFLVSHSWQYNGKDYSISLDVSEKLYDYYRDEREHLTYRYEFEDGVVPPNYFGFMISEHDRPVVRAVADELWNAVATEYDRVSLALSFVQSLPYAYDADSKGEDEYVRYPVETLVDGCGDCEDKVALLAAILYEMDVDFILLALPEHIAVGVHCEGVEASHCLLFHDKRYYYMETTTEGWRIGQIPENYQSATMEAVPVDVTPDLLIRGVRFESAATLTFEKATCQLQMDLLNRGPGHITGLQLRACLVEKEGRRRLLAEQYYRLDDLQEGQNRTECLSLKSLIKENTVLLLELSGDGIPSQTYEMPLRYSKTRR